MSSLANFFILKKAWLFFYLPNLSNVLPNGIKIYLKKL